MHKKFWLRTALASAAVTVPLTTAASTLPTTRDSRPSGCAAIFQAIRPACS